MNNDSSLSLLCRVDTRLCALPLESIIETTRPLPIEPVAGAPDFVLGLSVVRGSAVPIVDAGRLLSGKPSTPTRVCDAEGRRAPRRPGGRRRARRPLDVVDRAGRTAAAHPHAPTPTCIAAIGALDAELLVDPAAPSRIVPDDLLAEHGSGSARFMTAHFDSGDVERFRGIVAAQFGLQFDDSEARLSRRGSAQAARGRADTTASLYLSDLECQPARRRGSRRAGARADRRRDLLLPQQRPVPRLRRGRAAGAHAGAAHGAAPARAFGRLRVRRGSLHAGDHPARERRPIRVLERLDPRRRHQPGRVGARGEARVSARGRCGRHRPRCRQRWFRPVRPRPRSRRRNPLGGHLRAAQSDGRRPRAMAAGLLRRDLLPQRDHVFLAGEDAGGRSHRIAGSLAPGGYLFLGHAETLRGLSQDFHLLHTPRHFLLPAPARGGGRPSLPPSSCSRASRRCARSAPSRPMARPSWIDAIAQAAERIRALGDKPARPPPHARRRGAEVEPRRGCSISCSSNALPKRSTSFAPCRRRRRRTTTCCC